ncbi:MAG: response regulator, partial [Burkholderiales bacterium]|nr:response regulator [Burkholderiales bacterium]
GELKVSQRLGNAFTFEVRDTGLGIPAEQQALVFAPFHQTEAGSKKGGTGLGLAISSRQVELLGGNMQLESQVGKGTRFYFSLLLPPAQNAPAVLAKALPAVVTLASGQSLHALVVDDVEENRDVLARMLREIGAQVQTAGNGKEALTLLQLQYFDAVFLDIRMPVMDGVQALHHIRQQFADKRPVCIAITASALLHEKEAYLVEGFDDFIGKPFLFESIDACLQQPLGLGFTREEQAEVNIVIPEMAKIRVDKAWRTRLLSALEKGWINGIEAALDELEQQGVSHLAEQLRQKLNLYDLAGIAQDIEKIEDKNEPDIPSQ